MVRVEYHSACTQGGFAQGALVGGSIDCATAAGFSPFASGGVPLFAGAGLEPEWGKLVGGDSALVPAGCLLAHGATVPDSAPDEGVPLRANGAAVPSSLPGSRIAVGPCAQGAAVPTAVGGAFLLRGATVPDSETDGGVPLLADGAAGLSDGSTTAVGPLAQGAAVPTEELGVGGGALLVHGTPVRGTLVAWLAHGAWVPG